MLYRCRSCQHEVAGGCLPTVTCGLYFVFLLVVFAGCCNVAALGIRAARGAPAQPAEPLPWWGWVVGCPIALVVAFVGVAALNFALQLIEYLVMHLSRCPNCGARKWSWGFTRGFGL